ncbi:MAG: suppressor of fused domain protein [Weeksellaceae bacterium]|nr:suppressor of fused domain protein [Weeksellaceae bacterium]
MNLQEYKSTYNENQAVGALFLEKKVKEIYPELIPNFYSPQVLSFQGGQDALDGVAVYKTPEYYHLVSYGMSHLYYNEEAIGQEFSKWGFEFSLRVKPFDGDEGEDPFWAVQLMQNLGKFVYDTKIYFDENQFIPLGGPIRADADTDIVGVIFIKDPELDEIETPHGKVKFLQMIGIDEPTLKNLENDPSLSHMAAIVEGMKKHNPLFINQL